MKTPKKTKAQRIVELERKLLEAEAGGAHVYHFADAAIAEAGAKYLSSSGVVLTLAVLGGRRIFDPVLIRDGLSDETIEAIKADLRRSYGLAVMYKPKGMPT